MLMLLDGNLLVFWVFYVLFVENFKICGGLIINVVYGFIVMLINLLCDEVLMYIVVVFDVFW